jgi:HPt (histidine-containing phosphotransfer) domain-containing protein
MTAHAATGDREACLAAGMNDSIAKPVSSADLSEVIARWARPEAEAGVDSPSAVGCLTEAFPAEPEPAAALVFDRTALLERLMGDETLAQPVVEAVLEDYPRQVTKLEACLQSGDAAGAARQAHTLKGAASNIGAEALRATAVKLEHVCRTGDLVAVGAGLPGINLEFERLRAAVRPSEGNGRAP